MNSVHPDFQHFPQDLSHDSEILAALRAQPAEAVQTLNGELLDIDSARGYARFRFEVVPAFCHSQGRICQGGFLTGMVDTAMAMPLSSRASSPSPCPRSSSRSASSRRWVRASSMPRAG